MSKLVMWPIFQFSWQASFYQAEIDDPVNNFFFSSACHTPRALRSDVAALYFANQDGDLTAESSRRPRDLCEGWRGGPQIRRNPQRRWVIGSLSLQMRQKPWLRASEFIRPDGDMARFALSFPLQISGTSRVRLGWTTSEIRESASHQLILAVHPRI